MYLKLLNPSLDFGTIKKPINKIKIETIDAPIINGLKNRVNEIPELKIAIISVSLANFEVNQIIERNKKIGKMNHTWIMKEYMHILIVDVRN
mgnify:CR=1 FL=1